MYKGYNKIKIWKEVNPVKDLKRLMCALLSVLMLFAVLPGAKAASASGQDIVNAAMQYIGKVPYVWGGTKIEGSNPGADCSGFICRIYEKFGFNFWSNRTALRNCGTNLGTDLNNALPGDIIWFSGHVAIYAGKSNGSHMIVHETSGSFNNVVYTKSSVVKAELRGVIRIPGVTQEQVTPTATFEKTTAPNYLRKEFTTDDNACVVNKITKGAGTTVSANGIYLYDSQNRLIKRFIEDTPNININPYHSWYNMKDEVGVTLTPGTTYLYQMFGIFNGVEIKGPVYTFQTTGTPPVSSYKVNLYSEGNLLDTLVLTKGQTYSGIYVPTREGYKFDGWYTQETGGTRVDATTVFNGSSDQNLYARWIADSGTMTRTINFVSEGKVVGTVDVMPGKPYGKLPAPQREGYKFDGWFTQETGGIQVYETTLFIGFSDQSLYAHWTAAPKPDVPQTKSHTVKFLSEGKVVGTMTVTTGQPYGNLPTPQRKGYKFDGWFTSESGGLCIDSNVIFNGSSDETLYAHWSSSKQHTITLKIGSPYIYVDGVKHNIDNLGTVPVVINGRTMIPVRAVIEAMGGNVGWDNSTRTVSCTIEEKTLYLRIGNSKVWDAIGYTGILDSVPVIRNGRTLLPIRYVVEYFDGTVGWDGSTKTVTITW